MSIKGGDLLIECLKAQGVRCVFGMPGVQNLQIYDAIFRRGAGTIDHYLVRHEYAATLMAHGFARTTGDVGVALTVPGPGATNAATGLLEAFTDCVPVLLITGQSHSRFYEKDPSKQFHGLDQMSLFGPITKYCAIARSTDEIPNIVNEAFHALRSGRPGPVVLEFPDDVLADSTKVSIPPFFERRPGSAPDPSAVLGVSKVLADTKMPLIVAGSAVIHAGALEELRMLAEKLNAPVAVTRCAKGALREDHPLALTHCGRFVADEAMKVAGGTLAIGIRFTSMDTRYYTLELPRPFIQIDEDPREIGLEYPCELSIVGDLKASLRALIDRIAPGQNNWKELLQGFRKQFAAQPPVPLLSEIRQVLPQDGILSVDSHSIGYAAHDEFPVIDPSHFLFPNISVALGYAFPAALGAKVAHPDKPVVCFTGDGGFMMGSPELSTAMKYGMNVVTIIVNDRSLSAIKGSQQKYYEGRIIDADLHNPDFVEFAKSFGAYGKRVDDLAEFKPIFEEALSLDCPSLIEVPMAGRQQELIDGIVWLRSGRLRTPRI